MPPSLNALSLLYVDDDPDIRTIVQMALALDPAITLRTAGSGAEALLLAADDSWCPDLIVLDVMMPDMTGVELLESLRRRRRLQSIPAVFVTAHGREADLAVYKQADAKGIIVKPFDPLKLAAQIRAFVDG